MGKIQLNSLLTFKWLSVLVKVFGNTIFLPEIEIQIQIEHLYFQFPLSWVREYLAEKPVPENYHQMLVYALRIYLYAWRRSAKYTILVRNSKNKDATFLATLNQNSWVNYLCDTLKSFKWSGLNYMRHYVQIPNLKGYLKFCIKENYIFSEHSTV